MAHNRAMIEDPIVIIGGFGSDWRDYREMARLLAGISGRRVFVTHVARASWVLGGISDYKLLVERAHQAVLHALDATGARSVALVGHSAGGIIGRGYLADRQFGTTMLSMAGLLVGIAAGFVQLLREISKKAE